MKFTNEEIKMLAKLERDMDTGIVPFVVMNGQRLLVTEDSMKFFELEQGQTITPEINIAILERQIAGCREKLSDSVLDSETVV